MVLSRLRPQGTNPAALESELEMKQIEFTLTPDGNTTVETTGFQGGQCVKAVEDVKAVLFGKKPANTEFKPEYWAAAPNLRETE